VKVLVTGGSGFIGSHLCTSLLKDGYEVFCLDNLYTSSRENVAHIAHVENFHFVHADVEDGRNLELLASTVFPGVEQVYHLACPASPVHYQRDPVKTMRTAFLGTMNVFDMALQRGARVLIASTSEVYGDPEVSPQPESYHGRVNTLGPRACYDEGKRAAEALAYSYAVSRGLDVKIARIFNTYGPRMGFEDGRLIPNFVSRAMRKESLQIYGDGLQTRSLCYVDDTVDGLRRLMASPAGSVEAVNLGNPDERTVVDIAVDIASQFNPGAAIEHLPPLPDDPRQRCPDISRARELLDWSPKTAWEDGYVVTVDWFEEQAKGLNSGSGGNTPPGYG
jgi:UDP-glucuronate decarboxylase